MTNVGIIGFGHMGKLHTMNCSHIDSVNVVAAADQSKEALRRAQFLRVKNVYADYHDLFDAPLDLDAVIISLPNYLHFESIQLALEKGLHVFTEKPLANTSEECRRIVDLVRKSGRKLMVGHCMRFVEAVEKMKQILETGRIGELEVVTIEELLNGPFAHGLIPKPVPEWWFDPKKSGGGVLLDLGYHLIDLFRFFVGEDCKVLFSCLDHKFNLPMEDSAIVFLSSFNSSIKGIINTGWYQRSIFPEYNFRVILHGNAGYLSSDYLVPRNIYFHAGKKATKNLIRKITGRKIKPLSYSYYYESYYKELQHFFDCIKNDLDPAVSAVDGMKTVELIEEAYRTSEASRLSMGA